MISKCRQEGFTLIEVIIAVAIVAVVSGIFTSVLITSSRVSASNVERTTAESITQRQMEYIVKQPYDVLAPFTYAQISNCPSGYIIEMSVDVLDIDGRGAGIADTDYQTANDNFDDIHKVTVEVKHNGHVVMTTRTYKGEHD